MRVLVVDDEKPARDRLRQILEDEDDYEVVKVFPGTLNGGEVFICRRRGYHENRIKEKSYLGDGQGGVTRNNREYE